MTGTIIDRLPDTLIAGLGWTLAPWEDPKGLARPLMRDYSKHQGKVNHGVAAANGVRICASRSTISWGYQDAWFPRNWIEPKNYGMYRTSYHVLYPKESVMRQADNWFQVNPTIDGIARVMDAELQHDAHPRQVADSMWELSEICLARDGFRPIIYSRYMFINYNLVTWSTEMLNAHKWWLAQYLWDRTREHPGPPTLPNRVERKNVIAHQTADKKSGFPGEVESMAADYNRWEIGNDAQLDAYIDSVWGDGTLPPEPPPPLPPDPCVQEIEFPIVINGMYNDTQVKVVVDVEE